MDLLEWPAVFCTVQHSVWTLSKLIFRPTCAWNANENRRKIAANATIGLTVIILLHGVKLFPTTTSQNCTFYFLIIKVLIEVLFSVLLATVRLVCDQIAVLHFYSYLRTVLSLLRCIVLLLNSSCWAATEKNSNYARLCGMPEFCAQHPIMHKKLCGRIIA